MPSTIVTVRGNYFDEREPDELDRMMLRGPVVRGGEPALQVTRNGETFPVFIRHIVAIEPCESDEPRKGIGFS